MPSVTLELAQRANALALEVIEPRTPQTPTRSSVDERITAALTDANRPLPSAQCGRATRCRHPNCSRPREHHDFVALGDLADNVRIKRGGPLMHLKAYAIDGATLRTGSADFSASGERQQDNDLIVIRDVGAAAKFDTHFERMWQAAQP